MGLANYIALQLHPERIPDPVIEVKLIPLRSLSMSTQELFAAYPRPPAETRRDRKAVREQGAGRPGQPGAGQGERALMS